MKCVRVCPFGFGRFRSSRGWNAFGLRLAIQAQKGRDFATGILKVATTHPHNGSKAISVAGIEALIAIDRAGVGIDESKSIRPSALWARVMLAIEKRRIDSSNGG